MSCIFCGNSDGLNTSEHIIPESLGNDYLILKPGLVCSNCNNIFSGFESRVLNNSILGLERCLLGVITKKNKPAKSKYNNITWYAEPQHGKNIISAETNWANVPVLYNYKSGGYKMPFLMHDNSCYDISKLLLKIGLEIYITCCKNDEIFSAAINYILGKNNIPWPYFVIIDDITEKYFVSMFKEMPEDHEYIKSLGFDIYFHEINDEICLIFSYGHFHAIISLTSRATEYCHFFSTNNIKFVGCPKEYSTLFA
jgi:hypothetical protein